MKTTRQQLKKIPNVPCLYRHEGTGEYYGIKKVQGKIKTSCFGVSDRKLAEAKLEVWEKEKESVTGGEILLPDLCNIWLKGNIAKKPKTIEGYETAIKRLTEFFGAIPVHDIKVSAVTAFLADMQGRYAPSSFNHISETVRKIFNLAVADKYIAKNPFDDVDKSLKWKRVIQTTRHIPTEEEFETIVNHIRTQRWSDTREEAADLAEFMSLAALGTAECHNLRFEDIDLVKKEIRIIRQKTQSHFTVPFYPWLENWLVKFLAKRGNPKNGPVFKVRCIKDSMKNACKKLKFGKFSPRDLRKLGIERICRAGFPIELAAAAQGHKNTLLLQKVYRDVKSADGQTYRDMEIAKLHKKYQEEL